MDWPSERLDPSAYPSEPLVLPVFYGDLDTNGHVNNVALGRFFETARVVAHADTGLLPALAPGHVLVGRVAIDYLAETRFGAPLVVHTRVGRVGRSSYVEEQLALQGGAPVALAAVTLVHVLDGAPHPLPEAARAALARLVTGG